MVEALAQINGERWALSIAQQLGNVAWYANSRIKETWDMLDSLYKFAGFSQNPLNSQSEETTDAQSLNPEPQQEKPNPEPPQTILTINDTDKEKLVFGNALQKQYMSLNDGCYKWTLAKSLLAYMCGRLYCGDRIKEDDSDYSKEYIKGNTQMPAQEVKTLFGGVDVASNRYSIKAPPRNSWKVDELFKSNGASK